MGFVSDRGTVGGLLQRTGCGRLYKPGAKKGVLVAPGATEDLDWWFDLNTATHELDDIAASGYPVASLSTLSTWGNSSIRTDMSTLRTNQQSSGLFASGKVHLVGISMGGPVVLNWAKYNPTLVQSIQLVIGCVNIQEIYDDNKGGFQSVIAAAYGGGRPPDAENPLTNAASFSGIPINMYYSTTDTVNATADELAFAAASGAKIQSMGPVGHFWGAPYSGYELARFIKAND